MLNIKKIREKGISLRLVWDLFMIVIAVANMTLILFDLSYLYLRPQYLKYIPDLTEYYDPVKGIEPHPVTAKYLKLVHEVSNDIGMWDRKPDRKKLQELKKFSRKLLEKDPFAHTSQKKNLRKIKAMLVHRIKEEKKLEASDTLAVEIASDIFWTLDMENAGERLDFFRKRMKPLFINNYQRRYDLNGNYTDEFIWLDLPFLVIFIIEFFARWFITIRRKIYPKKFQFLMYNWYDVLGLIPLIEFRIFRLFRILSIYIRLRRSELTFVGDDFVSRTVKRYKDIITEEISDLVAIHILNEMQDEIRSGASLEMLISPLRPRRDIIKKAILAELRKFAGDKKAVADLRRAVDDMLYKAAGNYKYLGLIPGPIRESITREVGLAVFDSLTNTMLLEMQDQNALSDFLDEILNDVLDASDESELNIVSGEIALDILENMKNVVAVKKWTLKDQ